MPFSSLREFISHLEKHGELVRVREPVSPYLEMTEISRRVLAKGGPAVLFENVPSASCLVPGNKPTQDTRHKALGTIPALTNLFGTVNRVAMALGRKPEELREIGHTLAFLKQPEPPGGWKEAMGMLPILKQAFAMKPKTVSKAPCQEIVLQGADIDLTALPIQTCWPGDAAPLITWPLVVTKGPITANCPPQTVNLGIYRLQLTGKNTTLMRWLHHRGGAQHFRQWCKTSRDPMPVAAVIGADPATILAAVTPVPDTLSEYQFAGLLRGAATELVPCKTIPLEVPANAEIVLEGHVTPGSERPEGPHGDHTGYYNSIEPFPTFTISAITMRRDPIYHSTYTGQPPDEPSVLGEALNEIFIPLIQQQFPEIVDFWLPPEGCSYRVAVVSIKKAYAGHAKRIMMGVWSYLRQFVYTKFVIIVDDDIDARNWKEVVWAISTRMDPVRDVTLIENTPIDYLDFASPVSGLGGKMGLDATNKFPGETSREWGRLITMDKKIIEEVTRKWASYGFKDPTSRD